MSVSSVSKKGSPVVVDSAMGDFKKLVAEIEIKQSQLATHRTLIVESFERSLADLRFFMSDKEISDLYLDVPRSGRKKTVSSSAVVDGSGFDFV
jgi:hypothetical protein